MIKVIISSIYLNIFVHTSRKHVVLSENLTWIQRALQEDLHQNDRPTYDLFNMNFMRAKRYFYEEKEIAF